MIIYHLLDHFVVELLVCGVSDPVSKSRSRSRSRSRGRNKRRSRSRSKSRSRSGSREAGTSAVAGLVKAARYIRPRALCPEGSVSGALDGSWLYCLWY